LGESWSDRFYVAAEIPFPSGKVISFAALADTGADDMLLPAAAATKWGWNLSHLGTKIIHTASGKVTMHVVAKHTFQIDGVTVVSDVLFCPGLSVVLCGRIPLLYAFEIGFETTKWMRTK
jgi:predicted aspartyl protease